MEPKKRYIDHNGQETESVPEYNNVLKRRYPHQTLRLQYADDSPSLTQNSHHDATDINAIIARYQRTGLFPPNNTHGQYADVTGLQGDLTEMINQAKSIRGLTDEFLASYGQPAGEVEETPTAPVADPPADPE